MAVMAAELTDSRLTELIVGDGNLDGDGAQMCACNAGDDNPY
jgi:hypothetical protein